MASKKGKEQEVKKRTEQKGILRVLGSTLERLRIGVPLSSNKISQETGKINGKAAIDRDTVSRWLKHVYYVQNFLPPVNVKEETTEKEKMISAKVLELPKYIRDSLPVEKVVLYKLFYNYEAFEHQVQPLAKMALTSAEIALLNDLTRLGYVAKFEKDGQEFFGITQKGEDVISKDIKTLKSARSEALKNFDILVAEGIVKAKCNTRIDSLRVWEYVSSRSEDEELVSAMYKIPKVSK